MQEYKGTVEEFFEELENNSLDSFVLGSTLPPEDTFRLLTDTGKKKIYGISGHSEYKNSLERLRDIGIVNLPNSSLHIQTMIFDYRERGLGALGCYEFDIEPETAVFVAGSIDTFDGERASLEERAKSIMVVVKDAYAKLANEGIDFILGPPGVANTELYDKVICYKASDARGAAA